jgi:hypothetical protein
LPAGEDWSLVTAPDEQRRCCLVLRGRRCEHVTSFRVAGPGGALDDYTYACRCHLELVRGLDDVVTETQRHAGTDPTATVAALSGLLIRHVGHGSDGDRRGSSADSQKFACGVHSHFGRSE